MSLKLAARFAQRELRGGVRGFRIFLACIVLGVAAIAAVGTVRSAITTGIEARGAEILGGDAEVSLTYRFAREQERAFFDEIATAVSETVDFRSLAGVGDGQEREFALTQVRAVDSAYPLLGEVTLDPAMPLDRALAGDGTHPGAVIERLLADRLGLVPGDLFRLGDQQFTLMAVLETYPDNRAVGFSFGPRTIVLTRDLVASGLLAEGTLFSTEYRLSLPADANLEALKQEAEARFGDAGLRWRDKRRAPSAERFVDRIGDFLVLVGLSGLAVGGVGVSAAVRSYLGRKTPVIAMLKTLGATRGTILFTYAFQIGTITALGVFFGVILGVGVPLLAAPLLSARLPVPAEFGLYPGPILEAALYGFLTAALFSLWPLARAQSIRTAALFRDGGRAERRFPPLWALGVTVLLFGGLLFSAALFSGAIRLTVWTAGGIVGALALLLLAALGLRWIARRAARASRGHLIRRIALGSIGAQGGETVSVLLSLGLGLSVLTAVGQIDGNLRNAFEQELPDRAPSYFFVDIQPEQMDGFRADLDADPAVSKVEAAPMLRGVITRINGQPAKEVGGNHWVLEGDVGVTYSAQLPERSVLTAGNWWPEDYTGTPQISFSAEEAEEMGLSLGDRLTINILGRDFEADITSLRQVDFETLGIGFVISMNPSAVSAAPHSWIATVYADEAEEAAILRRLARAFPNITAIPVRDGINRVQQLVTGISAGVRVGALVTLATGLLVLIGAAAVSEQARVYETAILKTLGATRGRLLAITAFRSILLGLLAASVALFAGIFGGWAVMEFVMEVNFAVIWPNVLAILAGGVAMTLLTSLLFFLRSLAARPAHILKARE